MPYKKFFTAKTTTGAGDAYQWLGGTATMIGNSFGTAGSVKIQISPATSTGPFVTSSTSAILAAASSAPTVNLQLPPGVWIRPIVTTASTTGLNLWML